MILLLIFLLPCSGAELLAWVLYPRSLPCATRLAEGRTVRSGPVQPASPGFDPVRSFNLRVLGGSNTPPPDGSIHAWVPKAIADAVSSSSFRRETTNASKVLEENWPELDSSEVLVLIFFFLHPPCCHDASINSDVARFRCVAAALFPLKMWSAVA